MAYLTAAEATTRLSTRYGITATIATGDIEIASDTLDSFGPFIGSKQAYPQARAFPRTLNPDGTSNTDVDGNYITTIPDAVLDAVSLLALNLADDEGPAVTSESAMDRSVTYATPKAAVSDRRISALISPYLLRVGRRL